LTTGSAVPPKGLSRIIVAQALYAFGAALCLVNLVNTSVSIAVIVLVQLNYVFAPRIRPLSRL